MRRMKSVLNNLEDLEKGQSAKIKFKVSPIKYHEISCPIKSVEPDRIGLSFPEEESEVAKYLYEGREVEILIYTDRGIYVFDSIVIDSPSDYTFTIELPQDKSKIQRREYIRIPLRADFILTKFGHTLKTQTINLGGGGLRFKAETELAIGDIWSFILSLPHFPNPVKGFGEILYSFKQQDNIISVLKFLDIEDDDRNKIIKFCYDVESKKLKLKEEDMA
jgi:c-di-GMP-binding flagellar brake protein YcgR